MFFRPLIELSDFISESAGTDKVEVYYRFIFSERRKKNLDGGVNERGCRAFTRVRWQRSGMEWSVGLGGMIPTVSVLASLFRLASPRKAEVPIPAGNYVEKFSISTVPKNNANVTGWVRDLMVTASGNRLFAEGPFAYHEDDTGIWDSKPVRPACPAKGASLLLSPSVVLRLLESGFLKGIVCKRRCHGFFHSVFDSVWPETATFCRAPDTLDIFTGAVGIMGSFGETKGGFFCDSVEIGRNGVVKFYSGETKNWAVSLSMLKSFKKVSEEVRLYRNNILFFLPWVELEGGSEWQLP